MDAEMRYMWKYIQKQWGSAYWFKYNPKRALPFTARRRDDGLELEASTPEDLLYLIRADYNEFPVSRELAS